MSIQVFVREHESILSASRRFKTLVKTAGILNELRRRERFRPVRERKERS